MMLCKMLWRKPSRLPASSSSSSSWHFITTNLHTSPAALQSTNEDGGGEEILCSLNSTSNPKSSSDAVGSGPDLGRAEVTKTILKRYGFTDTQISKLFTSRPDFFSRYVHPEKTLLPKLDFYRGTLGFSDTDLPRFICSNPSLLTSSLHNQIVPVYNFIKELLSSDDEIVHKTLKRSPRLLGYSLEKKIVPGISALTQAGVPQKHIKYLLRWAPTVLGFLSLRESIKRATDMGFHPNKLSFVQAIRIFTDKSKSALDKKMEVYRKCGLSDAQILKAFRSHPSCMFLSEGNIEETMDFFVKKMGWDPVDIARSPAVLDYSLEKRSIPRCTVVRYLQGKGLLRKNISLRTFLSIKEKEFMDKFVKKYEDDVPGLMDIYLGTIGPPPPPQELIL